VKQINGYLRGNGQNVKAEESIFVDDTRLEADGIRGLGFTSFLLDKYISSM
jgi:hypothetical protein